MRVSLIIPPSVFLMDERVFMTLGILRVAAVLERAGHKVEMLDLSGIENYAEVAQEHARTTESEAFGITATTPQLPAAIDVGAAIRKERPNARIILGGPHVTLVNAARKREKEPGRAAKAYAKLLDHFDVLVAGDGEDAIFEALKGGNRLVDADDPKSLMFLTSQRLSELPMPARHLIDVDSYNYEIDGVRAISTVFQLGCPYMCGFCGGRNSPSLRRVRMRSADSIISELEYLYKVYGFRGFMAYDDELNVNPGMIALMNAIEAKAHELKTTWKLRGFIKAELFTDKQAEAMYRAGFRWILTGFESGSPRILKNIQKKASRDENTRCIEIAHKHGLKVKALMSLGHPGESAATVADTLGWLLWARPDDLDVTVITPYPGTPYYDEAREENGVWVYEIHGDTLYSEEVDYTKVADYYKGDPHDGYVSHVWTEGLSKRKLVEMRDAVEKAARDTLKIPFYRSVAAQRYEHSMGQLPPKILRVSA